MASANQRKATFISKKLKFLKNQGDHLINNVGLYVSRIIAAGESWMEGGDNKLEYLELCHMIDTAVEFLCEKCEELAGGSMDVAANQLSRPSCEQSNLAKQVITGTASSSAAPLASTATASYNQPAVSVQPADKRRRSQFANTINRVMDQMCAPVSIMPWRQAIQLRILCQMLTDRLTPLEQLRTSLNERASMREDNINKLSQVIQKVAVISPRLQELELKASGPGCGFSAYAWFSEYATRTALRQYKISHSTVGNNFDADSGIFTAPLDGLYVTSLSLMLSANNKLQVAVKYKQNLSQTSTIVSWCRAEVKDTNACSVYVVSMKVGDTLFTTIDGAPKSDNYISVNFRCFLLS